MAGQRLHGVGNATRVYNVSRPQRLSEFLGQEQARTNLKVFIETARACKQALDHVLLVGPPGLGKTTLARIVAHELGVNFRATSGPVIGKPRDLRDLFAGLKPREVLFIDEIHRLKPTVEETLYAAMEDFQLDLIMDNGSGQGQAKLYLPPFTLIAATTRAGLISNPLRERFGIPIHLNFYSEKDLEAIVARGAAALGFAITVEAANEIARRARGTPRTASRLLRRVCDFARADSLACINRTTASRTLSALEIDSAGLTATDYRYLHATASNFGGGPVGVDALAATLSESRDVIEDIIEPYLIQIGFIQRTYRGRILSDRAFEHLGMAARLRNAPAEELETEKVLISYRTLH